MGSDLYAGSVLPGGFRIERKLAEGGVASVFAGHDSHGAAVAIKVLHLALAHHESVRNRFAKEGYLVNQVQHPGVVRVVADGESEDGLPFIVMELLDGHTLEQLRGQSGGTMAARDVVRFGIELLDVVEAAHAAGIVHRDIKPENVMVTAAAELRVLDFGIARMLETWNREATKTGVLLGTAEFMSPEQAAGMTGDVDARTDIWGVGATLFMLLAGEAPYVGRTVGELLRAAVSGPPRPLALVAPEVPPFVAAVVDRALSFAKESRWGSAREMQEALTRAAPHVQHMVRAARKSRAGTMPEVATQQHRRANEALDEDATIANLEFPVAADHEASDSSATLLREVMPRVSDSDAQIVARLEDSTTAMREFPEPTPDPYSGEGGADADETVEYNRLSQEVIDRDNPRAVTLPRLSQPSKSSSSVASADAPPARDRGVIDATQVSVAPPPANQSPLAALIRQTQRMSMPGPGPQDAQISPPTTTIGTTGHELRSPWALWSELGPMGLPWWVLGLLGFMLLCLLCLALALLAEL
jgi:eukaryotic-like serine/threonine-protein kinase